MKGVCIIEKTLNILGNEEQSRRFTVSSDQGDVQSQISLSGLSARCLRSSYQFAISWRKYSSVFECDKMVDSPFQFKANQVKLFFLVSFIFGTI